MNNWLTYIMLGFSVLGAVDRIFGNHFGLGKEFEKAFMLLGVMALSMIGMIVISPLVAEFMHPVSVFVSQVFGIDSSVIPASLFANDMGGAPLAVEMAGNEKIGMYNALVVSSMMGCTISFTIPFALGVVNKENHRNLLLGLLCGVVTIPIGCFCGGVLCGLPVTTLLINLIPLIAFSGIIAVGLLVAPELCVRIFKAFGVFITALITVGLSLGIVQFLTGYQLIKGLATIEEGALVCFNAAVVLSGAFPLMNVISKVLSKPLTAIGTKIGINKFSVVGVVSSLASSSTTFGIMDKMDSKGVVMNSAFAVSGAFVLGSHLAFTMAFDSTYILPVISGKIIAGVLALVLAALVYKRTNNEKE